MSKFNAMLEIYIAMSESIGFCCRYFENRERDFFLWYCLVSIKMDLKFNLIFYFFFFHPGVYMLLNGILYFLSKTIIWLKPEMLCNDDSLTMQHSEKIL